MRRGEGRDACRCRHHLALEDYAFAWRSEQGLPSGREPPPSGVENLLIRIADGAVLARLGGRYWATSEMRANRYDLLAAWSPDSRSVIEVANSRWDSDSFAYYRIDGATAARLDLRALVEPVMTARLPPRNRQGNSFRVREDRPVTLDARGRLRFTAMLYVPKGETRNDTMCRSTSGRQAASRPRRSCRCGR